MIATLKQGSGIKAMNEIYERISALRTLKGIDARKYCGILRLKESPLLIQRKMRNEWK
jgi:hypothetical protein